jgi:hypothetical protein
MWHAWKRNVYKVLMGKPERKRPPGRPRHRWEDAIRMDLRDGGGGEVEWIQLAQDRKQWLALGNMVMNLSGSRATQLVSMGNFIIFIGCFENIQSGLSNT